MYNNLFKIYQDKIVINPIDFDNTKYYYFYGEDGRLFGIEKSITINEYKLIKSFYLEKTINHSNSKSEAIYKYIYENGKYPFSKKNRFLVLNGTLENDVMTLLKDLFINLEVLKLNGISVVFFEDDGMLNISDVFQTISDDFGRQIFVHEGLIINKNIKGEIIAHYLGVLIKSKCLIQDYSNLADLVLMGESSIVNSLMKELKEVYFNPILNKNNNKNVLDVYFKNDLNVSKSAKDLYLNRNSLINRLESISKEIGYNIQSFKIACIILFIINSR
ncbi:MAG: helix-turn-helix domain-containing protein [Bacilli bacterium]|nr:helix-turn-helix domain-containing protein [Bacilli bacterium]